MIKRLPPRLQVLTIHLLQLLAGSIDNCPSGFFSKILVVAVQRQHRGHSLQAVMRMDVWVTVSRESFEREREKELMTNCDAGHFTLCSLFRPGPGSWVNRSNERSGDGFGTLQVPGFVQSET